MAVKRELGGEGEGEGEARRWVGLRRWLQLLLLTGGGSPASLCSR